jgi:hypothetical protein
MDDSEAPPGSTLRFLGPRRALVRPRMQAARANRRPGTQSTIRARSASLYGAQRLVPRQRSPRLRSATWAALRPQFE